MLRIEPQACGLYGKRVLCAVSGGADSVALLRLLADARDRDELELCAAHFEHGIRGQDSMEDLRFVRDLCAALQVPLEIGQAKVPDIAERSHEGLETCARRLRHEFLEETRKKHRCDCIALAHHRRDRAETVLMHLLRGGGLKGAAAMPMKSGHIVRPLIGTAPEEIRAYLTELGQPWREDSSNFIDDNPRNALRLTVFPRLQCLYPGFESALCRFSEIAGEEDGLLARLSEEFAARDLSCFAGIWMLKKGETALMRRVLNRLLPDGDFETVERALHAEKQTDLTGGYRVSSADGVLYLIPPLSDPAPEKLHLNGVTVLEGVCRVSARDSAPVPVKDNGYTQVLAKEPLRGAKLRLWHEGDFLCPLGFMGKRKSLGDYFTDRHFPQPLRHRLPLLADGNEILWVPGLGISEKLRVNDQTPACRLTIKVLGGNSDAK